MGYLKVVVTWVTTSHSRTRPIRQAIRFGIVYSSLRCLWIYILWGIIIMVGYGGATWMGNQIMTTIPIGRLVVAARRSQRLGWAHRTNAVRSATTVLSPWQNLAISRFLNHTKIVHGFNTPKSSKQLQLSPGRKMGNPQVPGDRIKAAIKNNKIKGSGRHIASSTEHGSIYGHHWNVCFIHFDITFFSIKLFMFV